MAEPRQPWYKSVPGILTAATGFIAALSGLVAGLNQLGVFRREPPPGAVVGTSPAPADNTAQDSAGFARGVAADSAAAGPATPPRTAPQPAASPEARPRPPAPPSGAAPPQPADGTKPSKAPRPASTDTAGTASIVLPKGTAIALAVPSRTCAPAEGARRFTARVSSPVEVSGAAVIPAGATAALRLRRSPDSPPLRARLDSLVRSGRALPISVAQVRIPRGAVSGSCLEPGARLTVVLGEPVTLPRR